MFLLSPVSSAGTRVGCGSVPTDSKMSGLPSSLHCTLSATTTKVWAFLTFIFLSVFQCFVALLGLIFLKVCCTLTMKTCRRVSLYFHFSSGQIFCLCGLPFTPSSCFDYMNTCTGSGQICGSLLLLSRFIIWFYPTKNCHVSIFWIVFKTKKINLIHAE